MPEYERSAFPFTGYVDPVHTSMSRAWVDQLCNLLCPWMVIWPCLQLRKFEDATVMRYFACGQRCRCRKTRPSTCCKSMQRIWFWMVPVGGFCESTRFHNFLSLLLLQFSELLVCANAATGNGLMQPCFLVLGAGITMHMCVCAVPMLIARWLPWATSSEDHFGRTVERRAWKGSSFDCIVLDLAIVFFFRVWLVSVRSGPSHQCRARTLARLVPWLRAVLRLLAAS